MKLVVQTQLLPDIATVARLKTTVERFNEACNWIASECFARQEASVFEARKFAYHEVRERFGLSSQMAQLAIKAVCDAYKRDKSIKPMFRPHAAVPFDQRTMSFKGIDHVSLLTLTGRVIVVFILGSYQTARMDLPKGQSKLVLRHDGKWFLLVTVDVSEDAPVPVTDFIGVDMGSVNIATTDDGTNFTGARIEAIRLRYKQLRKTCQRTGTKSAKRKLHKVRKRESGFRRDTNHCIAKAIVRKAKGTACGIGVEKLDGIGERIPAKGPDARNRMKGWAFAQLRFFLTYKAALAGIPVIPVDPAYTSQTCPECGHRERKNRKTRDLFQCLHCSFSLPADHVGALNIRCKAIQNWAFVGKPNVGVVDPGPRNPGETTGKLRGFSPSST